MKTVAASHFKTHCLSLLDEVAEAGQEILISKRGKPVARLLPFVPQGTAPQDRLLGTMLAMDDLIAPPYAARGVGGGGRQVSFVADTHVLIWWASDPSRLTPELRAALDMGGPARGASAHPLGGWSWGA